MKLYLMQHGLSLSKEEDPKRPLSRAGVEDTQAMGRFLKSKHIKIEKVWHSPKLRSFESAGIIADCLGGVSLEGREDIKPADPVKDFPELIMNLGKEIMVAGHLPFLDKLASLLLSPREDSGIIKFTNSAIACFDYGEKWRVEWILTPALLP
ncbi:MAG: phosphohistidine phosphatase SixA [Candidatus Omnitrophica bacterium]|nr:phosphohistidine phosphatase SixA [Candidatus Omnitrophota bacterium]MBD3268855.1 phosphohistidine phosphatase SixA [Candidatus Omnitrophota bacterium]